MIEPFFEIDYLNQKLSISTKKIEEQVLFKIDFSGGNKPVIICRATNFQGNKFWTSVPEGRQTEAEQIGPLIEQYYRSKQN